MTEQQLREKLQFAYGNMPDATRAAFEHSLTHHRAPETLRLSYQVQHLAKKGKTLRALCVRMKLPHTN